MSRRIVRSLAQLGALGILILLVIYFADTRFRILPARIHNALPSHHAGSVVTDVQLRFCSAANPFSTCRLNPDKWHRVEKDLYLQSGWLSTAWLHVQRKKEHELTADDRVVVGVRISRLDPGIGEPGQQKERWESRPGGIWILRSSRRKDSDSSRAVTAIDVLYGADAVDPRPGWELVSTALLIETRPEQPSPRLSVRHGQPETPAKDIVPRVRKDGRFKILQISDTHFSTGVGACRDAIDASGNPIRDCEADPRTLDFIDSVLDSESPDLVVLSGDQIEGPHSPDAQSALFKIAAPLIARKIPYAAIFGNHDAEGAQTLSRSAQMGLLQTLPYNLARAGPEAVAGVGNYYVEILGPSPSAHAALTLYFVDSHALSPDEKHHPGYDWVKQSQIDWFRATARGLRPAHKKYSHLHMDFAFLHIPLPEYAAQGMLVTGGSAREGVTAPSWNSGFFDALREAGILAVGCGHDHVNDYCGLPPAVLNGTAGHVASTLAPAVERRTPADGSGASFDNNGLLNHLAKPNPGPWLCYAGGAGYGGYGGYGGYHRRMRVWQVDANVGRVTTWKRVACCGDEVGRKVDEVKLIEGGAVFVPDL